MSSNVQKSKSHSVPSEIIEQVSKARELIQNHLSIHLKALYLYGSALDGGLKPESDIDLLAVIDDVLNEEVRRSLMRDLLEISSLMGEGHSLRPLELTVVSLAGIRPWRHPARREMQFGEWLRRDIISGVFEDGVVDPDLAILLTKISHHSVALMGPPAADLFDEVPKKDFVATLESTLDLWKSEDDLRGDERNIVLTLARIWFSAATGKITSKDAAVDWLLPQIPFEHQPILKAARDGYLGIQRDHLNAQDKKLKDFVFFAKNQVKILLKKDPSLMTPEQSVEKMWEDYHLSKNLPVPAKPIADSFCNNEKDTNELADLVNKGIKRATASALWSYEKFNLPPPKVGDIFVVKDWEGRAVCIVKTRRVTILPFNQITEEQAFTEGEGDRSLAYWRRVHIEFYQNEFKSLGLTFDETMPIIFEEFEKIFP